MTLDARIEASAGRLRLDVELVATPGAPVAIVGPNGAGKTTLLRILAGLVPLDAGRIVLAGRVLDDVARREHVPPERRRVGFVFQDYVLFPHMTALENVAFGLTEDGAKARETALRWLESVGVSDHANTRPAALSGGQSQRVALARALATNPALLLLDEPLAALDPQTRRQVRNDLKRHLSSFEGVALVVTHDAEDAAALTDRTLTMRGGRLAG